MQKKIVRNGRKHSEKLKKKSELKTAENTVRN